MTFFCCLCLALAGVLAASRVPPAVGGGGFPGPTWRDFRDFPRAVRRAGSPIGHTLRQSDRLLRRIGDTALVRRRASDTIMSVWREGV
jgi:hypothetical protein